MTLFQVKIPQSKLPGSDQSKSAANVVKKCQVTEEKVFKSAPLSGSGCSSQNADNNLLNLHCCD